MSPGLQLITAEVALALLARETHGFMSLSMSGALNIGLDALLAGIAPDDCKMDVRRLRSVAPDIQRTQRRGPKYEGTKDNENVGPLELDQGT